MSQLRLAFSNSKHASPTTKLRSIPLKMLRSDLSKLPPFANKVVRLQRLRPDVAAVLEELVDRYIAEVS